MHSEEDGQFILGIQQKATTKNSSSGHGSKWYTFMLFSRESAAVNTIF
jgi:hypothetical protein